MKTKLLKSILAVVVLLPVCAGATVNSNSKVLDDIEYYVQTDKFTYDPGETVEMLYKVTNLGDHSVTFGFGQDPCWNFWIKKDGEQIFQAVTYAWTVYVELTFAPGQSRFFPYTSLPYKWSMLDDNGNAVGIGNYDVTGGFYYPVGDYYDYTKVSVPIEIIPEPATFVILAFGLPVLRVLSKRKI